MLTCSGLLRPRLSHGYRGMLGNITGPTLDAASLDAAGSLYESVNSS